MEREKQDRSGGQQNGGKSRNRGRNWKKSTKTREGQQRGTARESLRENQPKLPPVQCSLCGKFIDSLSQAIGLGKDQDIAHFDCVLRQLTEQERIGPDQRISYVGNGEFAVIEYSKKNFSGGFSIIRRIAFEDQKTRSSVKKLVAERKRAVRL